jgi:hypothetical protein
MNIMNTLAVAGVVAWFGLWVWIGRWSVDNNKSNKWR